MKRMCVDREAYALEARRPALARRWHVALLAVGSLLVALGAWHTPQSAMPSLSTYFFRKALIDVAFSVVFRRPSMVNRSFS